MYQINKCSLNVHKVTCQFYIMFLKKRKIDSEWWHEIFSLSQPRNNTQCSLRDYLTRSTHNNLNQASHNHKISGKWQASFCLEERPVISILCVFSFLPHILENFKNRFTYSFPGLYWIVSGCVVEEGMASGAVLD